MRGDGVSSGKDREGKGKGVRDDPMKKARKEIGKEGKEGL